MTRAVLAGAAIAMRIFHLDHLLPGDAPPITDAAVVMDDAGTVAEVGAAGDVLPRHAGVGVERVHGVAFPGLVNAHAHVELSSLRGRVPGGRGFVPWVDTLIPTRQECSPEEDAEAIEAACDELRNHATVAIGDVTNTLASVLPLARRGIGGAVFHEVFGFDRAAVFRRIEALRIELEERVAAWPKAHFTYAPAPHTLYTTHPDAVRALLEGAKRHGAKTSLHFAEHPGERRAIEHGDGPVPTWFFERTKTAPAFPKMPLLDYAESLGAIDPDVLLVHLTDAREVELQRIAEKGARVVLCPRSNLHIEGKLPPLLAVLAAGLAPALGTDSLASNASLDVLAEARALADRFPSVSALALIAMVTANGADALGRADLGRVAKGRRPGLFAIEGTTDDPAKFVIASVKSKRRVLVGRELS